MRHTTWLLRLLMAALVLGLILVAVLLWLASRQIAREWPEVAGLCTPIYLVIVAGLIPTLLAVGTVFRLLQLADAGEAISPASTTTLARLKWLLGASAIYAVPAYIGCFIALYPFGVPPLFSLGWLAAELVYLFLAVFIGLLERLFTTAWQWRQDSELTI